MKLRGQRLSTSFLSKKPSITIQSFARIYKKTRDNTHTRTVSIKDTCTPQKIEIRIILTDILSHPYIFYIFSFNFQLTQRMCKRLWESFVASICGLACDSRCILVGYTWIQRMSSTWQAAEFLHLLFSLLFTVDHRPDGRDADGTSVDTIPEWTTRARLKGEKRKIN